MSAIPPAPFLLRLITPTGVLAGLGTIYILASMYSQTMIVRDYVQSRAWRDSAGSPPEIFDFIVVGGGSAGAVVANRLSRHNTVLLLELGGDPNPISYLTAPGMLLQAVPGYGIQYSTVPQNHSAFYLKKHKMPFSRGKGLGGSSLVIAGIYQRGNPNDYDYWANATGEAQWKYDNLLPFFKNLEDYNGIYYDAKYHGKGGPMKVEKVRQTYSAKPFFDAALEKGYKIGNANSRQGEGFSEMEATMQDGLQWTTYDGYIKPVLQRKNLRIYRYSRVVKVHLDKRRSAYGVTFYRHGQRRFVRARKEIIVSAGVVDTPKLLMLSGIGPKTDLHKVGLKCRVNLPVGRNLQDHVGSGAMFLVESNDVMGVRTLRASRILVDFAYNRTGVLASNGASGVGFVTTPVRNDPSWPEIQLTMIATSVEKFMMPLIKYALTASSVAVENYLRPYFGHGVNIIYICLVRPKSRGYIKLASKDPFAKPFINPNYLSHPDDVKALTGGFRKIIDFYENTKAYKRLNARLLPGHIPGCEKHKLRSDPYFECVVRHLTATEFHSVGTARMGKGLNDPKAVLDPHLRVLKTHRLRVIDASIMPLLVNSNSNIATIMIGEVGSFLTRSYWASQYEICTKIQRFLYQDWSCFYSRYV